MNYVSDGNECVLNGMRFVVVEYWVLKWFLWVSHGKYILYGLQTKSVSYNGLQNIKV